MTSIRASKDVCNRFHQLMTMYSDCEMVECGQNYQENMNQMLRGNTASILFQRGDTLFMVYVPIHATRFIFDAYSE